MRDYLKTLIFIVALAWSFAAGAQGPTFNCNVARQPAELAICGSSKLSELDRILVAGYNYMKASQNLAAADKVAIPYYFQRLACKSDAECIARSQIDEIQEMAVGGAPVGLPVWLTKAHAAPEAVADEATYAPFVRSGEKLLVMAKINEQITLRFVLDSGVPEVSIPADVVLTLIRTGSIGAKDFVGDQPYALADGATLPSKTFKIGSLRVGDRVLRDVVASAAPVQSDLLLGQSFLSRFRSWSIDNAKQTLVLR